MTRKPLVVGLAAALAAALLLGGCVIVDRGCLECECYNDGTCDGALVCEANVCVLETDYNISLSWAFGPGTRGCADAYVDQVEVTISGTGISPTTDTVACSAGGMDILDLLDGSYTIDLVGLSDGGTEWYSETVYVDILGQDENLGVVELQPLDDADIRFTWRFGTSALGCTAAGVDRVRVMVYDLNGNNEFTANPIPYCSDLGAVVTNFAIGTWNLVLEGVCASDLSVGYELDVNLDLTHPFENDFGELQLTDVGGCP